MVGAGQVILLSDPEWRAQLVLIKLSAARCQGRHL